MKAVKEESISIIMFAFVLKELPLPTIQAGESFLIHHFVFDPFCMACKKYWETPIKTLWHEDTIMAVLYCHTFCDLFYGII